MPWDFDADKPIYLQLIEKIKFAIISDEIKAGQKLESVRNMAQEAGVNPNTMQRALSELERDNLIYSVRTSGRFVTEDKKLIREFRDSYARKSIEETMRSLIPLGYTKDELRSLMEIYLKEME